MSELDGRNIDNTHPEKLKRLEREEIENRILFYRKKKEFCGVSAAFFLFVSILILMNTEIMNLYFSIVPATISLIFGILWL
ncbi:MAG: hypothetical protein P8Q14_05880, partial [Vicingaceae bacterium]|nr:hypothetical protein [Vicingaceae bacterium]